MPLVTRGRETDRPPLLHVQDEVNQEKSEQNEVDGMKKSWLGTAAHYLAVDLLRLSDMPSRRRLRSSLTVLQSQCSAVGDRAFAVAGARLIEFCYFICI